MRTIVYVDGFNLYYQLKQTGYKWLNLSTLVRSLLSGHQVQRIKYYSAKVRDRPSLARQESYLRALATIPLVSLHLGRFKVEESWMRPAAGGSKILVHKTVEKQTDVSIGADMVHDAHRDLADCFVLLSNDSDQCRPLEILKTELKKRVIVFNPNPDYPAYELHSKADQVINVSHKALQRSQFPLKMSDAGGPFSIPSSWYWPDEIQP